MTTRWFDCPVLTRTVHGWVVSVNPTCLKDLRTRAFLSSGPSLSLARDAEVQGYLVCVQGLGWNNDLVKLCATGKPTLLVDNLFGGSGAFLQRQKQIMSAGHPVGWVASSNAQDLLASARHFEMLRQGKGASELAAAFRVTRRRRTRSVSDWSCEKDPVPLRAWDDALNELRQTHPLRGHDSPFRTQVSPVRVSHSQPFRRSERGGHSSVAAGGVYDNDARDQPGHSASAHAPGQSDRE